MMQRKRNVLRKKKMVENKDDGRGAKGKRKLGNSGKIKMEKYGR